MTRVLVVDDELQLRSALEAALTREGYDVVTVAGGQEGIELAATAAPDLMVLDLTMPGLNGLDVIGRLRPWFTAPILVLSGVTETQLKAAALDAGADDYLQKPFGLDELQARLRALVRRAANVEQTDATFRFEGGLRIDLAAKTALVGGREVRLTPTEWRLLRELVSQPGLLLTHTYLLSRVWDTRHGEETRDALRVHVRALRAKLGDDARSPRFIRTESGSGYRWVGVPEGVVAPPEMGPGVESGVDGRETVHELANAVTALRMAVQLVSRTRPSDTAPTLAAAYDRLEDLSGRVAELVIRLGAGPGEETGK